MEKIEALKIIVDAAQLYDRFFCGKNLLILFGAPNNPIFLETKAEHKNFLHLTGVKLNVVNLLNDIDNKFTNPRIVFYEKALRDRLVVTDFEYKDATTIQKLNVLKQTLNLAGNVKMTGDYIGGKINLKTDKLAGGVKSFIGFFKVGKYYVPNTVMEDDIRNYSKKTERVLAILSKKVEDLSYNKIESVAKKIDIIDLLRKISDKVPIDPTLLQDEHSIEKDTAATLSKCHQIEEWGSKLEQKVEQEHGIKKEVPETNRGSR